MRRLRLFPLFLVSALLLPVSLVSAQGIPLDPAGVPDGGSIAYMSSFPDPFRVNTITGGGGVDANASNLGEGCVGFINVNPDFRLTLNEPLPLLRFIFIADTITTDTTLVTLAPDGNFYCNNDAVNLLNPMVTIENAGVGDYAVWVGGFTPNTPVFGQLYVTRRADVVPGSTDINAPLVTAVPTSATQVDGVEGTPAAPAGTALDSTGAPTHGETALQARFLPDPFSTLVIGGGYLSVPNLDGLPADMSECAGYTESAPDFRLNWSGTSTRLRFHFIPATPSVGGAEADAGLIVRAPDGSYACNRDFASGYVRPSLEFLTPQEGAYHVWVSSETAPAEPVAGLLYITELATTPETVQQTATTPVNDLVGPDPLGAASNTVTFGADSADPFAVPVSSFSGDVDLGALNGNLRNPDTTLICAGFVSTAPTLALSLPLDFPYLRVFFTADNETDDPVLVVRMPDGRWYCGDDALGTLDPMVDILGGQAQGVAQVWVGSFTSGSSIPGTLYLTRGGATPLNPTLPSLTDVSAYDLSNPPTPDPLAINLTTPDAMNAPTAIALTPNTSGFPAAVLDPFSATNFGETSLVSATIPHTVSAVAGGDVDAAAMGGECVGWVTAQPDYRLTWGGSFSTLRFFFLGDGDATLVILGPDGTLHCNDDSFNTVSPTVDIAAAPAGVYNIWLGSFEPGGSVTGTLYITDDTSHSPVSP
jgi:hypothetical protein